MSAPSRSLLIGLAGVIAFAGVGAIAIHQASRARALEQETRALRGRAARLELELAETRAQLASTSAIEREIAPTPSPPAPITPEEPAPRVEALKTAPLPTTGPEAPITRAEVVRRGRGKVRVALRTGELALELVHIPAGVGWVGIDPATLPPAERAARALLPASGFSSPRARVALEEGFLIGACEVTNGEYLAVLECAGVDLGERRSRRGYLSHLETVATGWEREPVRGVTWDEAAEYCALLGRLMEAPVRLPSEIEWELAASGLGDAPRRHPWGESAEGQDVTPDGIHDLGLSVHEWCLEPWEPRRWAGPLAWVHRPSLLAVPAPAASDAMVCRGGSLESRSPLHTECAWRQGRLASTRGRSLGFRIAIPLP